MARKRTLGENVATVGNNGAGAAPTASGTSSFSSLSNVPSREDRVRAASLNFQLLLARTDGWLRCIPGSDGSTSYWKWKFVTGQWSGHYVMFVCEHPDWVEGIIGLSWKLDDVDSGKRRPTVDSYYDGV